MSRTSQRNCYDQLELCQIKKWKFTGFSEDLPPAENVLKGINEWKSIELLLLSILNSRSHVDPSCPYKILIQRNSDKSCSFSYCKNCLKIPIISTEVVEFWHNSAIQSTHGIVSQHLILTHLLTFFSLRVSLPWNARENKILLPFFTIYETFVRN